MTQSRGPFEGPFVAVLAAVCVVIGQSVTTDLAGQVASLAFGAHHLVPGGLRTGARAFTHLWSHLSDPKLAWGREAHLLPGRVALWIVLAGAEVLLVALGLLIFSLLRRTRWSRPGAQSTGPGRSGVARRMGRKAVARHTAALYGNEAARREPVALGVDLATGVRLFARSEDYILAVGIPRVGKGEGFVIPVMLRHEGPAVVTATRHDTYLDTHAVRAGRGPVFVFDPQDLVPRANKLRWNPVTGCEVPQRAILRARGFAGFAGVGAAIDGGGAYWEQVAASIIRSYLHAAALADLGVEELLDWSRRPAARRPINILSHHPDAARGWDRDLAASAEVEPRHRDSIWATVRRAFDCFADPKVLEATRVGTDTFDPGAFLEDNGTIYLMGSPGAQHSVAPIVAALIEDVVDTARRKAAHSASRHLESGLILMLDECANIAPLGDLPKLVAELGGLGITTAVIFQSVAAARTIWGEAGERALRDLANITLVWGGQKDVAFLEEISALAGEHDELVETITHNEVGTSSSWSPRRMPVLSTGDIANLAPNHAVVVSPHLRPRITHLASWRQDRRLVELVASADGSKTKRADRG